MLQFRCDDYIWDGCDRRFILVEHPTLIEGDHQLRPDVQAGRLRQGWRLMITHTDPPRGLSDVWTRDSWAGPVPD